MNCLVAIAPRNDIANIYTVIASPGALDKLREAISGTATLPGITGPIDAFLDKSR